MITQTIRRKFLEFFKKQGHTITPSASVVPHDDPTLLFTNAGMNPFKDVFLGISKRDYSSAVSSQKCIRVGGKHNDLENVGHTKRHLTFFEMLGNFSFNAYFKEEAIRFAWEVSTEIFGFDPERIWPTVFTTDDQAFEIWTNYVNPDKITRFGEKDNFWAMGETGPCGPCSELLYDRGPKFGQAKNPKEDLTGERFLEFWNLVFMESQKDTQGILTPLPIPAIDTGAGLERVVSLKLDVENVFQTDILKAIIQKVEEISNLSYEKEKSLQPAFHVIADHLRCLSFAIADGAQPSNVERGYVLRKVLRRAVRYGRQLGQKEPFLAKVLPSLIETMGPDYPELISSKNRISEILNLEEEAFLRTLRKGGGKLQQIIDDAKKQQNKISGEEAFALKDTYGFPLEEILLLAKDANLTVDIPRFEQLEEEARLLSKKAHKKHDVMAQDTIFDDFIKEYGPSKFVGYEKAEGSSSVAGLLVDGIWVEKIIEGQEGIVFLHETPFYAEKGGQVGDTGTLTNEHTVFSIHDCQAPYKGLIAHIGTLSQGDLQFGDEVLAKVNLIRRFKIMNNHTATHLLHYALQKVLGDHIKQAGSVVDASRLRFDFHHHKSLSKEELRKIEDLVNERIRENSPVHAYEIPFEEAQQKKEIKQFFGDKYDSIVRVIDIEDFSKELCGGTHTSRTGNIGLFAIIKEGSIAAGVRRIEAVTGDEAVFFQRGKEDLLEEISLRLKVPSSKIQERVQKLIEEKAQLEEEKKEWEKLNQKKKIEELKNKVQTIDSLPFIIETVLVSSKEIKEISSSLLDSLKSGVVILGIKEEDKCSISIAITEDITQKGIYAGDLAKVLAPIIDGGGGGKPTNAQVGGKKPQHLKEALLKAEEWLKEAVSKINQ